MHRLLYTRTTRVPSHVSRAFSVTPTLWNKSTKSKPIDLKPFTKPRSKKGNLHPTSKWHLDWVEPFCDLQFKSGLGFTKDNLENVDLLPEQKVFAECTAGRDDILKRDWELDVKGVEERLIAFVESRVNVVFDYMQDFLLQSELTTEVLGKDLIPSFTRALVNLCGLGTRAFEFSRRSIAFKFAGKQINNGADVYVAKRRGAMRKVVLMWEDKLPRNAGEDVTKTILRTSAAEIIGQMIAVHYQNVVEIKFEPCTVYAIRLIDDMVAFFKMEMTAEQVEAVCVKGVIPNSKLKV